MPYQSFGNYASDEAKETARLQRELRDDKNVLHVLQMTIAKITNFCLKIHYTICIPPKFNLILIFISDFLILF